MDKEIWKDIEGYEGLYQIGSNGNVYSVRNNIILRPHKDRDGYLRVQLSNNGKHKECLIHRLVGQAFIPNPDNLPCINHKDERKDNNCVSNIEWCSNAYNNIYGSRLERVSNKLKGRTYTEETIKKMSLAKKGKYNTKKSKEVMQVNKETDEIVAVFPSLAEVKRVLGYSISHICNCCKKRRKEAYGYLWEYKEMGCA